VCQRERERDGQRERDSCVDDTRIVEYIIVKGHVPGQLSPSLSLSLSLSRCTYRLQSLVDCHQTSLSLPPPPAPPLTPVISYSVETDINYKTGIEKGYPKRMDQKQYKKTRRNTKKHTSRLTHVKFEQGINSEEGNPKSSV